MVPDLENVTMSQADEELYSALRKIVGEHYEKDCSPLLLSDLGHDLRELNLWPAKGQNGKSLREYIEAANDPDLLIVRDKNSPAYVAVTTAATKQIVEAWIERRSQATAAIPDIDALPRSVLLAFCVQTESGQHVFLRKTAPFKYGVTSPENADREQDIEVEDRYRRPGLKLSTLSEMSASDRLDLQTRIAAWSRDKNTPIDLFYKPASKKRANALERLLAAQPPGVASKIVIPGDIALLLSRQE
jgi:hypothetical protein